MGNHALRCKVAAQIKELNLPSKLYKGRRHRKEINARRLRRILEVLEMLPNPKTGKPGVVVGSCSTHGFWNKRITGICTTWVQLYEDGGYIFCPSSTDLCLEDDEYLCGCSTLAVYRELRFSQKQIEEKFQITVEKSSDDWEPESLVWKAYCWLKAGAHITDDDGVLLPQWQEVAKHVRLTMPGNH